MRVPGTPRPGSSSAQRVPGTPRRPRTPRAAAEQEEKDPVSDDVVIASPERKAPTPKEDQSPGSSSSSSSSSGDAELIDVANNSPLGNTGLAKDLCDVAIAAAVNIAFGNLSDANANPGATNSKPGVEIESHAIASLTAGETLSVTAAQESMLPVPSDSAESKSSPTKPAPLENTLRENDFKTTFGNTGGAHKLCSDAIDAVVESAMEGLVFGGTAASLLEDVDCGGTMNMTFGGTAGLGNTRRSNLAGTLGATGDVPPVAPGEEMAPLGNTKLGMSLGATGNMPQAAPGEVTFGNTKLGASLAATGNIPQVAPGEVIPGDVSVPTTPRRNTMNFLKAALGNEENAPVSPSLMSISHYTPSPTKRDLDASYQGDSPSLVILEEANWVPCKPLPAPTLPAPKALPAPKEEKDERPVRCGSPAPLSARGRERHEREMAALLAAGKKSARGGSRPRGKGVRHLSVAGGA
jgi:hypothetical protein